MSEKDQILEKLAKAVFEYNEEDAMAAVKAALDAKIDPVEAIIKGLSVGINRVGDIFGKGNYPIAFVMLSGEVFSKSSDELQKHVPKGQLPKPIATMVIGTVEGDIHTLGVDIITAIFSASGFKMHNLGGDVPVEKFINKAEEVNADIIGASALMSNTVQQQRFIAATLKERGIRNKYIYMVGGGAFPGQEFCSEIAADGYATDVTIALEKAKKLIEKKTAN